jgi:DNA-binding IclR family transcriptional regulator
MYVDKTTRIAGWPALQLRTALRSFQGWPFHGANLAAALQIPETHAAQLIQELVALGYLKLLDSHTAHADRWQCTDAGFRLADAHTTKPYRRTVA